jgi:S-DNA-T family DNA segregation ATPase FtsK/SpoIIIE
VSKHLRVSETLGLLDRLQQTMREFGARSQKLEHHFKVQTASARRTCDVAVHELNGRLDIARADAEAKRMAQKARSDERYVHRIKRLAKAVKNSHQQRQQQVEDFEGKQKYQLQRDLLNTDKHRDVSLASEHQAHGEYSAQLAEAGTRLATQEQTANGYFSGYAKLLKLLANPPGTITLKEAASHSEDLAELDSLLQLNHEELGKFGRLFLPAIFRNVPCVIILLLLAILHVGLFFAGKHFSIPQLNLPTCVGSGIGTMVLTVVLYVVGRNKAEPLATKIAAALAKARRLYESASSKSVTHHEQELQRIAQEHTSTINALNEHWAKVVQEAVQLRSSFTQNVKDRGTNAHAHNDRLHQRELLRADADYQTTLSSLQADAKQHQQGHEAVRDEKLGKVNDEHAAERTVLDAEWLAVITPLYVSLQLEAHSAAIPDWNSVTKGWQPPKHFDEAAPFARLAVDVEALAGLNLSETHLPLPGPAKFTLPLSLVYPRQGSLLIETDSSGHQEAVDTLNEAILRLLAIAPPGRASFTIIDPVGLGQSFAGIMHLADHGEHLINSRIWTQPPQIEKKLGELCEHMEKVIQMYLRNEYETIFEYNEKAGTVAEKYHFLIVSGFPSNFSEQAAKRLLSIASSGARCGVFTLIHWDTRLPQPQDFVADELRKSSVTLTCKHGTFSLLGQPKTGTQLTLSKPPGADIVTDFIQRVGESSINSNRIEVPFSDVTPEDSELWSVHTDSELRVPIGRSGATKLQYLAIGHGTRQHGLIAGKTGSGKSTLFHVIITNLALWCSPEEVEFYLVDFKKGVEFKCYAARRLPHARVIAIESDREFGLSVLQKLDDELRRRGELYRKLGVQDLAGYKRAGGKEPMPRSLLLIDEFQEFFVEDDRISQGAALLLDRIVRQGRAFGIHVILGSQSLGGAYTLARTTMGQMVIRIALQCNEADAYLIMDDNNPAPRLLNRPGEGIYNDTAGTIEGNSPFQTVWLSDAIRDEYLEKVVALNAAKPSAVPAPIIFEGNEPADVRENLLLQELLSEDAVTHAKSPRIWLGSPNSIKGPTEAIFQRQSGSNLLIVGQRSEAALSLLMVALVSLSAQYPAGQVQFCLIDSSPAGSPEREHLETVIQALPHPIRIARGAEAEVLLQKLAEDHAARSENAEENTAPETFLFIPDLPKNKRLRFEEDFSFSSSDDAPVNPGKIMDTLITQGPATGIHVIAICDTLNNVNRFISRKALTEFEMRVLFQMGANDSANLIDSAKASTLGLHRAIFYNEHEGVMEIFRPYALPSRDWVQTTGQQLARLQGGVSATQ